MEWTNSNISVRSASTEEKLKQIIKDSKVIVFDLDGTLYEGKSHFDYYANLIKLELPIEKQELFAVSYSEMLNGSHPVKIGTVYDAQRDYVITLSPETLEVASVCDWNGNLVEKVYESPFNLSDASRVVVGDGWFLPVVAAVHCGLTDMYHCYYQTKDFMSSDAFFMEQTKGLKDSLVKLKETKKLILMTNAEADDVKNILEMLELTNIFDVEIADAKKPEKTIEHLENIKMKYCVKNYEMISIGDNFINEVFPAVKLGMNGICITNHQLGIELENLFTVRTLENLFE